MFFPVAMIPGYPGLFLFSVGFQYIKLLASRNKNGTAAPPLGFLRPEVSAFALLSAMESILGSRGTKEPVIFSQRV